MSRKIITWGLDIGLYPGILIGIRSYSEIRKSVEANKIYYVTSHVLYLPFIDLCLDLWYDRQ